MQNSAISMKPLFLAVFGKPSTMLWPAMAAVMAAATWIWPNHNSPWRAFHEDAWMVLCALCLGAWVVWKCGRRHTWSVPSAIVVACAAIPLVQWQAGLIATSGQAMVSSAYILALGLSMVMAHQMRFTHGKLLAHILFAAIGLACIVNVGLQLFQWFALYNEDYLSFVGFLVTPIPISHRPAGNLLQPNQFATLLCWGFIAGFWGYVHRAIRPGVLALYIAFLGLGLAITQSRIGLIELCSLCIAMWWWRRLLPNTKAVYACAALLVGVMALYLALPTISNWLLLEYVGRDHAVLGQDSLRLGAYRIYFDALLAHPWFGYGIGPLGNAYLELAQTQAHQVVYFLYPHSMLLDVMLWVGIPLGALLVLGIIVWLRHVLIHITTIEQPILLMVVVSLGLHAMVELPHYFAYFLVPAGLAIGTLGQTVPARYSLQLPRWVMGTLVAGGAVVWAATVYDYLLAEEHYAEWRFEQQHIGKPLGHPVPKLLVLNQLEYMMQLQRLKPAPGMSDADLQWVRAAVRGEVSQTAYFAYVGAMALNGQREEAVLWMYKLNAFTTQSGLKGIHAQWRELQLKYPQIADLEWAPSRSMPKNL
jgi:Virulence factor membrane-bound polymerase, C-terminal/O-Antigen ligase